MRRLIGWLTRAFGGRRGGRGGAALILALALAVGAAVAVTGAGAGLERGLLDMRAAVRLHRASGHYVLVEIDARSVARLDRWPWPRRFYVSAIRQLERAGANTIAFDVDFSARSSPAQDRAFAAAIDAAKVPVILPTFRQFGSSAGGTMVENLPIPELRRHAELADVNIAADSDGLVRHYVYGIVTAGTPRPSIGAILAGSAGRIGDSFAIDGAIDPASIPRISFVDLLAGRVAPGALAGKSVLIGATAIELGDRYAVPRYGVIPGPVIQLLAAETLYAGSSPTTRGSVLPLALALVALGLAASRPRRRQRAIAIGLAAVLILLLPLVLEAAHVGTVTIVPALVALVAGGVAITARAIGGALRSARLTDAATGLPNRKGFDHAHRARTVGAVVALRLTNYSDAAALVGQAQAADLMQRVVKRLEVAGIAPLYRLEDGVLAWTIGEGEADICIHEIEVAAALLRVPVEVGGRQIELRCCFGLSHGGNATHELRADRAIVAADHALERGTRYEIYDDALGAAQDWRLSLAGELDRALAAGNIWVAYQPKLDIARGRVTAAEALVRWQDPVRGAISPDAFIPALEASGRILDLTLYVLARAAADAARWRAAGTAINVAVNVSAVLTADPRFLDGIDTLIAQGGISAQMLTLEITESAALGDADRAVGALAALAARGIKLSIDDYGTGQSTLTYLKRLPAREIKVDKSFVLGLANNRSDQAMVRSTIELAHELGYTVVAEGVETAAILDVLATMGCDVAQGWHVGMPMPADAFAAAYCHQQAAA